MMTKPRIQDGNLAAADVEHLFGVELQLWRQDQDGAWWQLMSCELAHPWDALTHRRVAQLMAAWRLEDWGMVSHHTAILSGC